MTRLTHSETGDRLHEIAFDLYERYVLLDPIGRLFRPDGPTYEVLDVGGHTEVFWPGFSSLAGELIPNARVAVVDLIPTSGLRNYVQASGVRLPFRDGAFDLVCSFDTLEHVPGCERTALLAELLRVTRDGLYVAFPFDSASNRWAESVVREYTHVALGNSVPALLEHQQFGLPEREFITSWFAGLPHSWIGFGQGNTDVWLLMMMAYHSLRMPGTDFVKELNGRFNRVYAARDWAEPHYRAGYLLSKRRSIADLEGVRASFGCAANPADLAGVLAFCQLFLTIAQNGRALVDKDRHIRNIEHELADARAYREKWDEVAAMLARLEAADRARADEIDKKLVHMTAQLDRIAAQAAEQSEQSAAQAARQLETIRERIDGLRRPLELQARLDGRVRDLEAGLVTARRSTQAIYDSRIWRALCALGGVAERLTGRRSAAQRGTWARRENAGYAAPSPSGSADGFVALVCDYPGSASVLPVRDTVEIRGWALAESGIDCVWVQINDEPPAAASYGIPRPDVARSHPGIPGAEQCGYRYFWDTSGRPEGPCAVRVTAVTRNGQTREVACHVSIDWKTPPDYGLWISRNEPTAEELDGMRRASANFASCPRISIAVPVHKTPIALLARAIESVMGQTYPTWELCLADDCSQDPAVAAALQQYAGRDDRIRYVTLEHNRGISGATNAALSLCAGDYVAFLDHDDELAPFALSEVVQAINDHPETDVFYSDEDKIDERGRRYDAFFKPDWSPELFRSCNYVCHFTVMKRRLAESLGGLDESYSGSQDYEFLLRASERTQAIRRIPKILYHWRAVAGSAAKAPEEKPAASADGQRALAAYLERNAPGACVEEVGACRYRVRYAIREEPRVSILIPTGGHKNVFRALESVLEKTAYPKYDILLIDNSCTDRVEEFVARLAARQAPIQYLDWRGRPFNFSQMNNAAARATESPYILFLNDDTTVIDTGWLTAMLEQAQRPEVGAVGAQLWYPNGTIQHAGVVMGIHGNCSHAFKGLPGGRPHYFDFPNLIRNASAVTGACLLVAREKFFAAGAFDEVNLAVAFQDVDLCLKLLELGYRNVYTPYAKLYHYESATKTEKDKIPDAAEDAFMKNKWARYIANDPYYNPNLARRTEDFSLALD